MTVELAHLSGNINIGLYSVTTESYSIIADTLTPKFKESIKRVLNTEVYEFTIDPTIVGALIKANSNGLVLSSIISEDVERGIKKTFPELNVTRFDFDYFALGNLILTTDKISLISPLIPNHTQKLIGETLDTEVISLKLNNSDLIGSLAITNSLGAIASPLVENRDELDNIMDLLSIQKIDVSTVNRGAHFPSSGILCNSKGALIGQNSTGIETIAISNALFPN
jgi:translation initiation factor 6